MTARVLPLHPAASSGDAFVSLMDAVTRIGLGRALSSEALQASIAADASLVAQLDDALARVLTAADQGRLPARGRHLAIFRDDNENAVADTGQIPPARFKDFTQWDLEIDGLRRRPKDSPSVLWPGHPAEFAREFTGWDGVIDKAPSPLSEGYRDVQVHAGNLLQEFPNASGRHMRPSFEEGIEWCLGALARGVNGMNAGWKEFKDDPRFAELSRDGFFRQAWTAAKTKS